MRRGLASLAVRLALAWAALSAAALGYGDRMAQTLVPLYGAVITAVAPDVPIRALHVRRTAARAELYMEAQTAPMVAGLAGSGTGLPPVLRAVLSVGLVTQSLVVTLCVVLAWPATGLGERLWLVFLGAYAALIAQVLTVPFLLLGEVEGLTRLFTAGALAERPVIYYWFLILDNGGVFAVALATGISAVALAREAGGPVRGVRIPGRVAGPPSSGAHRAPPERRPNGSPARAEPPSDQPAQAGRSRGRETARDEPA